MPQLTYFYNPKTLRYEPSRISTVQIVLTTIGLLSFGVLFFVGLVLLQNFFVETSAEKSLLAENQALSDYKVQLAFQLGAAHSQLSELKAKDKSLYEKIFETKKSEEDSSSSVSKQILLAEVPAFRELMSSLFTRSSELHATAQSRNTYFGDAASIGKKDIALLSSIPSFPPIADFDASKLVSGYGMRINPFHKGNYHHDGIDLAAPRGEEVLAAAQGTVIQVNSSELQAGFGSFVTINHGNGYVTEYANLGTLAVHYGQRVSKGQSLGTIGISGGSIAPHVHYEVLVNGKNVDPVKFLIHGLTASQYEQVWVASRKKNQSLD